MKALLAMIAVLNWFAPAASAQSPKAGVANFSQVFSSREFLMQHAQRASRRGSGSAWLIAGHHSILPLRHTRVLKAIK